MFRKFTLCKTKRCHPALTVLVEGYGREKDRKREIMTETDTAKGILGIVNTYFKYFRLILIELLESPIIDSNVSSAVFWLPVP